MFLISHHTAFWYGSWDEICDCLGSGVLYGYVSLLSFKYLKVLWRPHTHSKPVSFQKCFPLRNFLLICHWWRHIYYFHLVVSLLVVSCVSTCSLWISHSTEEVSYKFQFYSCHVFWCVFFFSYIALLSEEVTQFSLLFVIRAEESTSLEVMSGHQCE